MKKVKCHDSYRERKRGSKSLRPEKNSGETNGTLGKWISRDKKIKTKKKEMYIILKLSAGNKSDSPGKCDLLKITRFFFFQNCGQLYNAFLCVKIIIEKQFSNYCFV